MVFSFEAERTPRDPQCSRPGWNWIGARRFSVRTPEIPMTQTPITPASPDDIVLEDDTLTQRLDRQADAILAEGERRSFEDTTSLRQALREDAELIRSKVVGRVETARDGIRDEPMKTTLYALGVGVIIGMLLRR
ncbi:MAG: hypothetical protein DCF29_00040 [Alphaproteobacteria bacterium]|nr:MAG: hypothetical protein DCF29_00040 [Alphaproteobacteria bacterium]